MHRFLSLACLMVLPVLGAPGASLPPDPSYKLLFADEFDGDRLNETHWVYRLDRRGGEANFSGINGLNRRENVRVSDGLLRVRVDQEVIDGRKENTGGGIITKKRFGYGYYECRYRPLMGGNGGVHTAFWQRGPNANVLAGQPLDPTTPQRNILFEIDSSEIDNPRWEGTNNLYDVIAPKGMSDGYPWPARFHIPIKPLEGGWFIDAYEYTPEGIIFYDNHVEVARIRYDRIRGQQNIWLTALNGFGTIKDTSIFPGESDFDYFRYYAKDFPGANLLANEGFEYNLDSIDPQEPIAWHEAGDVTASSVTEGGAFLASHQLRHASDRAYKVVTSQTLHYILDGTYAASAMVRSSGGQRVARFSVASPGGKTSALAIPAGSTWTRIVIPSIAIVGNEAIIAIESDADAGQWLEVDDVQFLKPASPEEVVIRSKPFEAVTDPIWRLCDGPTAFRDGAYSFFGREVGLGEAITVAFSMKPDALKDQVVLERMPRTGESGWGVRLTAAGEVVFRVGSVASHSDVIAKNAYSIGSAIHVACVFDRGTARLFINGREAAVREGIPQLTQDKTAAGSVGAKHRTSTKEPYSGILQDIRVHNRALSAAEVLPLATAVAQPAPVASGAAAAPAPAAPPAAQFGEMTTLAQFGATGTSRYQPNEEERRRVAWFREARFGLFMHWGLYSKMAGYWKGQKVLGGEWALKLQKLPIEEYRELAKEFNPVKFNADEWVLLAKASGMKYLVITTKHHDGFSMFDSDVTTYDIVDATPFKRDPIAELKAACDRHGLKLGLYYSHAQDWNEPDGYGNNWSFPGYPRNMDKYLDEKSLPQIRELCLKYKPAILWFDTAGDITPARAEQIAAMVRGLVPDILINSRIQLGKPRGLPITDFDGSGDNEPFHQYHPVPWELCGTLNRSWAYKRWDENFRPVSELLFNLIDAASKNGNYLLNVGPTAEGEILPPYADRIRAMGDWLKVNGEAIYGTDGTPWGAEFGEFGKVDGKRKFVAAPAVWRATTRPGKVYIHILQWPQDGKLTLPALKQRVSSARMLSDPSAAVRIEQRDQGIVLRVPATAPDPIASVVVLDL